MSLTALDFLAVALGGALGGVARFWLSQFVAHRLGERFPWGTLAVNVTGSAMIGVAAALALGNDGFTSGPSTWALLVIGILGSYTTVSSFSFQTHSLLYAGETGRAVANIAASVILCLGAAAAALRGTGWVMSA